MGQRPWQYHGRRASRARGNARPDNGGWPAGKQCGLHRTGLKEAHWGHRQAETTGTLTATAVRRCACEVSSSGIARTARFAFGGDRLLVDRLADHTEPTGCDLARLLASLGVHSEVIAASMIPPASEWQVGHRLAARPSRGHSLDASSTVFGLQSASLDASHRSSNCDTVTPPGALVVLLPPPELREKPARHPFWVSADRALFQLDAVRLRVTTKMPWRRRDPFTITSGRPTGRCLLRELRVGVVGPFPKGGQPIPGHVVGGGEASRCTRWSTVGAPLEHRWSVRTHCGDGQSVPGETARSSIGRSRR